MSVLRKLISQKNMYWIFPIIGFLIYLNSLPNGFVSDDEPQILQNPLVHSLKNFFIFFFGGTFQNGGNQLGGIYYKPLTVTYFSTIFTLFGPNSWAYHFFQITLHVINSLILFKLFQFFLKRPLALILSLIFLIHPLNVESVGYISAAQEPLFFLFGILSLYLFIKSKTLTPKNSILITTLLTLSLLSKETGIIFVLLIPIYTLILRKEFFLKSLIPITISLFIYLSLRLLVAQIYFNEHPISPLMEAPLLIRLLNLPKIFSYYLVNTILPHNLEFAQSWMIKTPTLTNFYLPLALLWSFVLTTLGLAFWLYKKHPSIFRPYLFFLFWFYLSFGLHSNIIPLDMTVADRWFYLPLAGLLGLIGLILNKINLSKKFEQTFLILTLVILITLSTITIIRNSNWKTELTLYSHDYQYTQGSSQLENIYGVALGRNKRYQEAQIHFENSIKLYPTFTAWVNLGVNFERLGNIEKSEQAYLEAIKLNDTYSSAYENLAILYYFHKTPDQTKKFTEDSLKKFPRNSKIKLVCALAEYQKGATESALKAAGESYLLDHNQLAAQVYLSIKQGKPLNLKPD